jgi:uncharacterized protein
MRRKEKEIQDRNQIDQIIAQAQVCRLGLSSANRPYIVPVSFGYDGQMIYFHTASEGMKIDYIASNPQVCFEFEHDVRVVASEHSACKWTVSFYSVIGFGTVVEFTDPEQKRHALNQIVEHYSGHGDWEFNPQALDSTRIWGVTVESISGKQSNDKAGISPA